MPNLLPFIEGFALQCAALALAQSSHYSVGLRAVGVGVSLSVFSYYNGNFP